MIDENSLPLTGPSSFNSMLHYVEAVLRDNWVPGPDNTRREPYASSARALLLSILHRMDVTTGGLHTMSHTEATAAINRHIHGIRTSVVGEAVRRGMYHTYLTSLIAMGWTNFSKIQITSDVDLADIMEGLDILTVEHVDAAISELETSIMTQLGDAETARIAVIHVGMIRRRRKLVVKEETSGDEDD